MQGGGGGGVRQNAGFSTEGTPPRRPPVMRRSPPVMLAVASLLQKTVPMSRNSPSSLILTPLLPFCNPFIVTGFVAGLTFLRTGRELET